MNIRNLNVNKYQTMNSIKKNINDLNKVQIFSI